MKNNNIPYEREKEYNVEYKGIILPHKFHANFVVYDDIVLEVKSVKEISNDHLAQILNYYEVSRYSHWNNRKLPKQIFSS